MQYEAFYVSGPLNDPMLFRDSWPLDFWNRRGFKSQRKMRETVGELDKGVGESVMVGRSRVQKQNRVREDS